MRSSLFSRCMVASLVAGGSLMVTASAPAALTTSFGGQVTVAGTPYNVYFNKQTQSATTFNDVFGTGSPALTFTTATDATAAVNAILAAVPASQFDPFGLPTSGFAGFFVPFIYSQNGFNRVGANYLIPSGPAFVLGAPNNNDAFGRNQSFNFSFATFTAVPEPTALMAMPAAAFAMLRRRSRKA